VSIGVVRQTRLRTGVSGSSAACIATSVPPMHQPSSETSSAPVARRVSRIAAGSASQT
jgi:hypothetical protein